MEFLAVAGVERARRLIGQNDVRLVHQRARHGHTLLFATRKRRRFVVGASAEVEVLEQFEGACLGRRARCSGDEGGYHHVFEGGKFRKQLVELEYETNVPIAKLRERTFGETGDVGADHLNRSFIGAIERAHDLEEGGFARTRGADNAHDFALVDGQIDAFEHMKIAKGLVDIVKVYHAVGVEVK